MELTALMYFVPLAAGIAWLFYLIFKANLASQPLGKIISYFVGALLILLAVGWAVTNLLPRWANDILQNTIRSTEWRQVIDTSSGIVENTFTPGTGNPAVIVVQPTVPASIIDQQPPIINGGQQPGSSADQPGTSGDGSGPSQYVIQQGDTLTTIATRFGTTVEALKLANGLVYDTIYAGDTLIIPASGK